MQAKIVETHQFKAFLEHTQNIQKTMQLRKLKSLKIMLLQTSSDGICKATNSGGPFIFLLHWLAVPRRTKPRKTTYDSFYGSAKTVSSVKMYSYHGIFGVWNVKIGSYKCF